MSEWISVVDRLPAEGFYLVRFIMLIIGDDTPFKEKILFSSAYFNPCIGWTIENRYIKDPRYSQEFLDLPISVMHWMPLPNKPEES